MGNSLLCVVKSNFKKSITLNKEGVYYLKTSNDEALKLDLKKGRSYYVKAGVNVKSILEKQKLTLMANDKGTFEFNSFHSKN